MRRHRQSVYSRISDSFDTDNTEQLMTCMGYGNLRSTDRSI